MRARKKYSQICNSPLEDHGTRQTSTIYPKARQRSSLFNQKDCLPSLPQFLRLELKERELQSTWQSPGLQSTTVRNNDLTINDKDLGQFAK